MQFIRSLIFTVLFYITLVLVFVLALPTLILPSKATLICGKILAHLIIFLLRFVLGAKVSFLGIENLKKKWEIFRCQCPSIFTWDVYTPSTAAISYFYSKKRTFKNSCIWLVFKKNWLNRDCKRHHN